MAGRFEGLKDAEWKLLEDIFPGKDRRGRGMPAAHPRKILNSLLWLLITGCRWCDLPRGSQWASRSARHRWLKAWHLDGKLDDMKARLLGIAQSHGLIHWISGAFDGSFSPWERRRH
jgi:transposase